MDYATDSDWLTTKEACLHIRRSPSTLTRWWKSGKIPKPDKPSPRICYYRRSDLDNYIKNTYSEEDLDAVLEKTRIERDIVRFRERFASKAKQAKLKRDNPQRFDAEKARFLAMKHYLQSLYDVVQLIPT